MFKIEPIRTKEEQRKYCELCHIEYDEDYLAYAAFIDGAFSGICQFRIIGDAGMIRDLVPLPGVDDFEVMFIMGRSTMNFIDLCGVHLCRARKNAGEMRLLTGIGFRDVGEDSLFADMTGMFDGSHCASKHE